MTSPSFTNFEIIRNALRERDRTLKYTENAKKQATYDRQYSAAKNMIYPFVSDPSNFESYGDSLAAVYECDPSRGDFSCKMACQVAKDLGFKCKVRNPTMDEFEYASRFDTAIYSQAIIKPRLVEDAENIKMY